MSQFRYGAKTLLFWPEPDIITLAAPIVKNPSVHIKSEFPTVNVLAQQLSAYLQKEQNWDNQTADAGIRVNLSELPAELQRNVRNYAIKKLLNRGKEFNNWFDDDFWNQSTLALGSTEFEPVERLIIFGYVDENKKSVMNHFISFPDILPQ